MTITGNPFEHCGEEDCTSEPHIGGICPCRCIDCNQCEGWEAGARAVIARLRDLHKESLGFETAAGAAAKIERELKGET